MESRKSMLKSREELIKIIEFGNDIKKIINSWDPLDLLSFTPDDEYDTEIRTIRDIIIIDKINNDINNDKWVDDAYTVYLFTPAEPNGGVRMAYNGNPNIFINHTGDKLKNIPGYWGKSETEPHFSGSKNYEKFHNLILLLRTVRAN